MTISQNNSNLQRRLRRLKLASMLLPTFMVTTVFADSQIDPIQFDTAYGAPETKVFSTGKEISGIDEPVRLSIQGGKFSINNARFTRGIATVRNGDTLRLGTISSATPGDGKVVIADIGGVKVTFTVVTGTDSPAPPLPDPVPDPTPDPVPVPDPTPAPDPVPTPSPDPVYGQPPNPGIWTEETLKAHIGKYVVNWTPDEQRPRVIMNEAKIAELQYKAAINHESFDVATYLSGYLNLDTETPSSIGAEDFAIMYFATGDERYKDKAIFLADHQASQPVSECDRDKYLRAKGCLEGPLYVFDWFYTALTPEQRSNYLDYAAAMIRAIQADNLWAVDPYLYRSNNYRSSFDLAFTLFAIVGFGEHDYANEMLTQLLQTDLPYLFFYINEEVAASGYMHDGGHYGRKNALDKYRLLQLFKTAGAGQLFDFMKPVADARLKQHFHTFLPGFNYRIQDGDAAMEASMKYHDFDNSELALLCEADPASEYSEMARYWMDNHRFHSQDYVRSSSLERLLNCPADMDTSNPLDSLDSHFFAENGAVYSRSHWGDNANYLFIKCTADAEGHNHPDCGHWSIAQGDDYLTVDLNQFSQSGIEDTTTHHNVLLINGKGPASHRGDRGDGSRFGSFKHFYSNTALNATKVVTTTIDSTQGYQNIVADSWPFNRINSITAVERTFIHTGKQGEIVVVYDLVTSDASEEVTVNLNTTTEFQAADTEVFTSDINGKRLAMFNITGGNVQLSGQNMTITDNSTSTKKQLMRLFVAGDELHSDEVTQNALLEGSGLSVNYQNSDANYVFTVLDNDPQNQKVSYILNSDSSTTHILTKLESGLYQVSVDDGHFTTCEVDSFTATCAFTASGSRFEIAKIE